MIKQNRDLLENINDNIVGIVFYPAFHFIRYSGLSGVQDTRSLVLLKAKIHVVIFFLFIPKNRCFCILIKYFAKLILMRSQDKHLMED